MNVEEAVPFFSVASMENSIAFYVTGLGFEVSNRWDHEGQLLWCRLQLGGAGLMLQQSNASPASAGQPGRGVSIYFICNDALALYREFSARGITAKRPFVGNGMWVVSLTDPDGYSIHFESPTDAPEESEFDG